MTNPPAMDDCLHLRRRDAPCAFVMLSGQRLTDIKINFARCNAGEAMPQIVDPQWATYPGLAEFHQRPHLLRKFNAGPAIFDPLRSELRYQILDPDHP